MRVLILDNHPADREQLITYLGEINNMEVVGEAATCSEAITQAHHLEPDLIISEIQLPNENWLEAMKIILTETPKVRIIILTTCKSQELLLRAIQMGARGYLIKNTMIETLLPVLPHLAQDEFIVCPTLALLVFNEYSRLISTSHRPLEMEPLTVREREILRLICGGYTNREVASNLVVSENTVRVHLQHIYKKLNLKNRQEARKKYQGIFS